MTDNDKLYLVNVKANINFAVYAESEEKAQTYARWYLTEIDEKKLQVETIKTTENINDNEILDNADLVVCESGEVGEDYLQPFSTYER